MWEHSIYRQLVKSMGGLEFGIDVWMKVVLQVWALYVSDLLLTADRWCQNWIELLDTQLVSGESQKWLLVLENTEQQKPNNNSV